MHATKRRIIKTCCCGTLFEVQALVAPRVTLCPPCRKAHRAEHTHTKHPSDEGAVLPAMVAISMSDRTWNGQHFYQVQY